MRKLWIASVVVLLAISGTGAAVVIALPPVPEQVIEGHTVFLTIEIVPRPVGNATKSEEYAAAVAVLVRERLVEVTAKNTLTRFPGVLWFNDQYLVDPEGSSKSSRTTKITMRYPCSGAVIAVNRGDLVVDQDMGGNWTLTSPTYVESYFITDPNDRSWYVDLWNTSYGPPAWSTAILNNQSGVGVPDNGICKGSTIPDEKFCFPSPLQENLPPALGCPQGGNAIFPSHESPGANGRNWGSALEYNAVLYMRLIHLNKFAAPKDHTETTGAAWQNDVSGCSPSVTNTWNCPGGNDDREGNSHPYNPGYVFNPYDGANNHGGSDICNGIGADCHATRNIDLYYGYVAAPLVRKLVVEDLTGSTAPYHCHQSFATC